MKKVLITTSFVFIAIFSFVNIAFAEYAFDRGNNSLDNTINRSSSEEGSLTRRENINNQNNGAVYYYNDRFYNNYYNDYRYNDRPEYAFGNYDYGFWGGYKNYAFDDYRFGNYYFSNYYDYYPGYFWY